MVVRTQVWIPRGWDFWATGKIYADGEREYLKSGEFQKKGAGQPLEEWGIALPDSSTCD